MEQLGLLKETDWVEYKLSVPHQLPDKFVRISEIILQKYNLKIKKLKRSEIKSRTTGRKSSIWLTKPMRLFTDIRRWRRDRLTNI